MQRAFGALILIPYRMTFETLGLDATLLRAVKDLGWDKPTQIQRDAVPPAKDGRDVLACAMTGSGKTAAFLLPMLHRLHDAPTRATRALVLTPTRELAAQVHADLQALAKHSGISGAAVFGGVGMGPQETAFKRQTDVIIATPGRLLDHMGQPGKYVDFKALEILVLDEADRMLDMGFLPAIKQVLAQLPTKRQTLFFSATLPPPIVALSRVDAARPVRLNVERVSLPATGIEQALYPVPEPLKADLFIALLRSNTIGNVICFTRTKHRANRLADVLTRAGHPERQDPRQPEPAAAHRGPRGLQERQGARARGHGHRGARHRRRGAGARGELRRAARAGGLHPPRGPHRARRGDGRGVHAGVAGGGGRPARDREGDRQAHPAPDGGRVRLRASSGRAAGDPDRRADRGDPGAEGGGAGAGQGQARAEGAGGAVRERGAFGGASSGSGRPRAAAGAEGSTDRSAASAGPAAASAGDVARAGV
jgi:hypothetical protein